MENVRGWMIGVVVCVVVAGCGVADRPVDARLEEPVRRFELRYETTIDFPVRLVDGARLARLAESGGRAVGHCRRFPQKVFVDRSLAREGASDLTGDGRLEAVVFHELGHCQFGLRHDHEMMPVGDAIRIPASLMNADVPMGHYSEDWGEHYRAELERRIEKGRAR